MSIAILSLLQAATLAYAIVGGVFIAFSDFIMRSLARTSGTGGIEAMQIINREVFRWLFMALFIGLAPVSIGIALYGLIMIGGSAGNVLCVAGLTYVIGCFGVTVCYNVPLNERLAKVSVADASTVDFWEQTYVPRWTWWNTVRGLACVVSSALMIIVLPDLP